MKATQRMRSADASAMPSESPVRSIVVGMGGISGTMLRFLAEMRWHQVVGAVDIRPQALAAAGQKLELDRDALFTDLGTALAAARDLQATVAIVNTPSELHYAQAKAALEAGLHVLVAKPITNNFEEAVALVQLAETRGLRLCVGQQMRYNRHYTAVRSFLASGRIGEPEMVNFLNAKPRYQALNLATMSQPALYEMSCHHFDSLLSLWPERMPESILIDGFRPSWSVYAGPCSLNGLLRFSGGLHLLYHGGFSSQADLYELRAEGPRGALRCRGLHMSNDKMDYEVAPRDGEWQREAIDADVPLRSPWIPFFEHWHSYLTHGTDLDGNANPSFSGRSNLKVFAMLSAGIESIEQGRPVAISGNPRYAAAFA